MYIFIDESTLLPYSNEILKRYVGNRLVKVIANPTEKDLKEFGYMELVETEKPSYDEEKEFLVTKYEVSNDTIIKKYEIYKEENAE